MKRHSSSKSELSRSKTAIHGADAFIFSGNLLEIKVGKNLGLMYHRPGDAGHVKISLPIQGEGGGGIRIFTLHCEKYI